MADAVNENENENESENENVNDNENGDEAAIEAFANHIQKACGLLLTEYESQGIEEFLSESSARAVVEAFAKGSQGENATFVLEISSPFKQKVKKKKNKQHHQVVMIKQHFNVSVNYQHLYLIQNHQLEI